MDISSMNSTLEYVKAIIQEIDKPDI